MYFNTLDYFFFFLVVYLGFHGGCRFGLGGAVLLVASIAFYLVAGVFDAVLIASVIGLNWLLYKFVEHDKPRLFGAVLLNIGVLVWVKYRAFFSGQAIGDGTAYIDKVLPLGTSFYTFQLLAFQIDAKSAPELKQYKGLAFPLFVGFFPQLIAGPIVRAKHLLPQVANILAGRQRRYRLVSFGLGLCLLGLVKKVIFADSLAPLVDDIFYLSEPDFFQAWLGAWLFSFQIYFDFSGYSDIALGCAYLLGVRLPWNFRTPYVSLSPREFWQRWHITLSTWIRDYLYIPLGGNRGGALRQLLILLFVMGLAGLWHGADLSFIVWGLGWGAYIGLMRIAAGYSIFQNLVLPKPLAWLPHMLIVVVLWVLFRAPNADVALQFIDAMFSIGDINIPQDGGLILLGCLSLIGLHFAEARWVHGRRQLYRLRKINHPFAYGVMIGLCLWLVTLPSYDVNPFIYFRF